MDFAEMTKSGRFQKARTAISEVLALARLGGAEARVRGADVLCGSWDESQFGVVGREEELGHFDAAAVYSAGAVALSLAVFNGTNIDFHVLGDPAAWVGDQWMLG